MLKTLSEPCLLLLLFLSTIAALEHQWVSWDNEPLLDELPVLHTAFVQTGEELHYFSESTRFEAEMFVGHRVHQDTNMKTSCKDRKYHVRKESGEDLLPIEFDPPFIEFGDHAVGVPSQRRIFVRSRLNKPIVLDSIMGGTVSFHSSFFDTTEISSLGTTFFDVVFLPREEGKVSTALHIHTSVGIFVYEISGLSTSNPYRIVPFVGTILPFNGTVYKDITIHNPHSSTFRINEILSSGGNAHVEMSHDIDEKMASEPLQYWDIRPFQTRTVGRILIIGHTLENITNFIRVGGLLLDDEGKGIIPHSLVLPIPLEITKRRGVFTTSDILDFGLLRQGERSQPQMFSVYQFQLNGKLEFETLYVEKGDATGIYMEFASNPPIAVHPGKHLQPGKPVDLVKVFFDASRINFETNEPATKHFFGRIIAVSRGGNYNITLPFRAVVYQGDIFSVGNDLALQGDLKIPHKRAVRLKNSLPFGVAVWNISVSPDARQYFTVRLFGKTTVIGSGEERPVFLLKYNKRVPDTFGSAVIYVHTNVSTYRVQMWKYSGKIQVELFSVDQDIFDFGVLERGDSRTIRFVIRNNNRAIMTVRGLKIPNPSIYRLYLVSILAKHHAAVSIPLNMRDEWVQGSDLEIPPEHYVILDFELRIPMIGSYEKGQIIIATEFESRVYPINYEVVSGSLSSIPDRISFGSTHPGKVVYRSLQVFNSFDEDMTVTRLSTISRDPRIFFESFDPSHPPILRSGRLTNLGRVMFLPEAPCTHNYCYLGLPLHTTDGQWFVHGLTLPANLAEVDSYLYKKQRLRYDNLVKAGKHIINTTVVIDTDKAKNIQIETSAEMIWPRLLTRNSVHFPLTALGNFTIVNLTLANPTSVPIAVQVIPLVIYPDADVVVEFFREHLITPLTSQVEMNETLMFSLRDTELFTLKPDSPVPRLREELEAAIPQTVPRFTLSLLLKPHMKVRLRLGFLPSDYTLRSSLLLIRNNLTIIEPVVVYGRGAVIGMKVEGTEARSKQPLLFEIRHDHLSDCNNPKRLMHKLSSTLTVRRPFTVSNTGEVPFTVVNMSINGVPCENRGFRILNCYPFRLQPNETYLLDVAYTPDFLTTTNEADLQLYMHMNGSSWLFPLAATVPVDMMARCHRALPRPPFENLMYYSCVTALIFCLVCVLACAYLEGDRAIACAIRQHYTTPRHVFDLNNLDTVKKSAGSTKEGWSQSSSLSGLHASADASVVSRAFYQTANSILKAVHFVWRWSLLYRNKQEPPKIPNKKKKKTPVSVINAKTKEKEAAKEKDFLLSSSNSSRNKDITNRCSNSTKSTTTQQVNNGRKIQPVAPMHKLSAKTSMSPKAPAISRTDSVRKKSNVMDTERRLARAQHLMDDFETCSRVKREERQERRREEKTEERRDKQALKPAANVNGTLRDSREFDTTSVTPVSVAELQSRSATIPVSTVQPTVSSLPSVVDVISTSTSLHVPLVFHQQGLEEDYNLSDEFNRPITPTPSLASSIGAERRIYQGYNEDNMTSNHQVSSNSLSNACERRLSESEISIVSELSAAPDWMDEVVGPDDVDDDFSAMAAATEHMMSGSGEEWIPSRSDTPAHTQKKKSRRKRGGRGRHGRQSGSESVSSVDRVTYKNVSRGAIGSERGKKQSLGAELQEERRRMVEAYQQRTEGLDELNWPMPDLHLDSLIETDERCQAGSGLWPSVSLCTAASLSTTSPMQWTQSSIQSEMSFDPYSRLGLSLGTSLDSQGGIPYQGTLFSGRDFGLWSEQVVDPAVSWANVHVSEEEK